MLLYLATNILTVADYLNQCTKHEMDRNFIYKGMTHRKNPTLYGGLLYKSPFEQGFQEVDPVYMYDVLIHKRQ